MSSKQILVEGMTEQEIRDMFNKYRVATINFIKPYKDKLIVNFEYLWKRNTKNCPYFSRTLDYFLDESNKKYLQNLYNHLWTEAKRENYGGSRNLFKLDGKSYQIVSKINLPDSDYIPLSPITIIDIFETDTYLVDKEYQLTDEEVMQDIFGQTGSNVERQLKEVLIGIYETDHKDEQTFKEFADGWDFWIDKDGDILVEGRGMKPIDGVKKIGYADNGEVYAY